MATIALTIAVTDVIAQHRAALRGTQLEAEQRPEVAACDQWASRSFRACQPVRSCRDPAMAARMAPGLTDQVQAQVDGVAREACRETGCSRSEFRNIEDRFFCAGPQAACLSRTLEFRCSAATDARVQAIPRDRIGQLRQVERPDDPETPETPPPRIVTEPVIPDPTPIPGQQLDLVAVVDDCVDPPVGVAPVFTAQQQSAQTEQDNLIELSAGMLAEWQGSPVLAFGAGGRRPAASSSGNWCLDEAVDEFHAGLKGPDGVPPVKWPEQKCAPRSVCPKTRRAWIQAHYNIWVARAIIHKIASESPQARRAYLWNQPGMDADGGALSIKTSPAYWFGEYSEERFKTVKRAIDQLWSVITSARTGGIGVLLRCPNDLNPGNVCFTKKPAAHHIVKGNVDLCQRFFEADRSDWDRARLIAHELLHHLFVQYGNIWVAVQDTHYHGHGLGCGLQPRTGTAYGEDAIRELVTYRNQNNNDCGHLARNVRNNDTYAYFITTVGDAVYRGQMFAWPKPADPTPEPPPPECAGEIGCTCLDKSWWPAGKPFEPDGDGGPDLWCPDDDVQVTCQATKFGAQTVGICTRCDDNRGPGCECDLQRPCDTGSCFGMDTFGSGGVGSCYTEPPPSWACLADCSRLFNSPGAWCYSDYPTGRARCMDHLCEVPDAFACHAYQDGKVCRYGDCVVECNSSADCQDKGYPANFVCQSHRCEYGFPTSPQAWAGESAPPLLPPAPGAAPTSLAVCRSLQCLASGCELFHMQHPVR